MAARVYLHVYAYSTLFIFTGSALFKCECRFTSGIACRSERQTRDRKVASLNPDRSGERISSSELILCADSLFGVRFIPVLPQWHVKDPGHFCQKSRRQVTPKHAYTLDSTKSEWADCADVRA